MKQPPFFETNETDLWAYLDGSLSESERTKLEKALAQSKQLRDELERCKQTTNPLKNYQQQAVPPWNPESMFRTPVKATKNWLPMAVAATALVISLLPYIHINDASISFGKSPNYISEQQLQQSLDDFGWQQNIALTDKLEQLKNEQNIKNQPIVTSLLTYAEKRRRNDLTQMASWFSRQSELNQNQQRQIVNWVVNEQQQDQQAISALYNSINGGAYPASNEENP